MLERDRDAEKHRDNETERDSHRERQRETEREHIIGTLILCIKEMRDNECIFIL